MRTSLRYAHIRLSRQSKAARELVLQKHAQGPADYHGGAAADASQMRDEHAKNAHCYEKKGDYLLARDAWQLGYE